MVKGGSSYPPPLKIKPLLKNKTITMQTKRYIPKEVNDFLKSRKHIYLKWNNDLSSTFHELDYEGLVVICDTILRIGGSKDLDKKNFVEIHKTSFHKILHNKYSLYLDYLIDVGIVICDNIYIVGEKSLSYKISDEYISDDKLESIKMYNKTINTRTIRAIEHTETLEISKKHKYNFINNFDIDYELAIEYLYYCYFNKIPDHKGRILDDRYKKDLIQHKLLQIRDRQLFINRSKTNGRINSNLTILNGDYKKFIKGYDISLDITSSQPLLLAVLINIIKCINGSKEFNDEVSKYMLSSYSYVCRILKNTINIKDLHVLKNVKIPNEKESQKWRNLCETGKIYEYFQREFYAQFNRKISRTEVKQMFLAIMFSSSRINTEEKKLFNHLFPSITKFMGEIKNLLQIKKGHKLMALTLQSIESYIWIELILKELDKFNIKYHFIHDSVIVNKEDEWKTEEVIREKYSKLSIYPNIKIENLK